jgi:L-ribulose-5-phosphate 3-epimerase UlaE
MTTKQSIHTEVSQTELDLLNALRDSPLHTEQLTKTFKRFKQEVSSGIDAYEAELQVVEATRLLGKLMVEQWAVQTEKQQSDLSSKNQDLIKHGKKNSTGTAPSGK